MMSDPEQIRATGEKDEHCPKCGRSVQPFCARCNHYFGSRAARTPAASVESGEQWTLLTAVERIAELRAELLGATAECDDWREKSRGNAVALDLANAKIASLEAELVKAKRINAELDDLPQIGLTALIKERDQLRADVLWLEKECDASTASRNRKVEIINVLTDDLARVMKENQELRDYVENHR